MLPLSLTASTVSATAAAPAICGSLAMEGGWTQTIYHDACYTIEGKTLSAQVSAACDCDFSKWEQCDTGRLRKRTVTGVPVM
ncbi:hypothetical protein EJ02DRAFT_458145, partial [Clathrospora elynae]